MIEPKTDKMKKLVLKLVNAMGYDVIKRKNLYPDIKEEEFWSIYNLCKPFTMTSVERLYSLFKSVEYILEEEIPGVFVECGVWRGGSAMLVAQMLANRNIEDRKIYLFDTYEGMSETSAHDVAYDGREAEAMMNEHGYHDDGSSKWCYADLTDVKNNINRTDFNADHVFFIKGKVEDTIPSKSPEEDICLLRLDTDWYESTKHELEHLFPKLTKDGVLIIDDYGHWEGCRRAVDEYFEATAYPMLLNRVDYTARLGIKTITNKN